MQHLLLAALAYTAFVVQLTAGPTWAAAGIAIDLLTLTAVVSLFTTHGNATILWVATFGLLADVLHRGPVGVGVTVLVVGAMIVAPLVARRRSITERLLLAGTFLAGTVAVSTLARRLLDAVWHPASTFADTPLALATRSTLHTLVLGVVVATLSVLLTLFTRHRAVRRARGY